MNRTRMLVCMALLMVMMALTGCADPNPEVSAGSAANFWQGLIDGFTAIFVLIAQVFGNNDYGIYQVDNNGLGYDAGFLLGVSVVVGASASGT